MNRIENDNAVSTEARNTNAAANGAVARNFSGQLEAIKQQVFAEFQPALSANEQLLRLALIEADVLARQTEYPHLLFPVLATEKAQKAARWQYRQRFLLRGNGEFAFAA